MAYRGPYVEQIDAQIGALLSERASLKSSHMNRYGPLQSGQAPLLGEFLAAVVVEFPGAPVVLTVDGAVALAVTVGDITASVVLDGYSWGENYTVSHLVSRLRWSIERERQRLGRQDAKGDGEKP